MSRRYLLRSLSLMALAGAGLTLLVLLRHQPELPVRVRWSSDLTTDSRPALERRYSLTDPKQAEDRVWSYRLRDRSIKNVLALLADPHVEDTVGIDRHTAVVVGVREDATPPRATKPAWARLRAPRPQSYGCLILGTILLALARAKSRRWRLQGLIVALAAFLLMAISFPLPTNLDGDHDSWMGDFSLYVQDRGQFETYTGNERVFFPSHLASVVVGFLDRVMGSTPASPSIAFLVLSWTATAVLALELLLLAALDGFSAPAIRYAGLCLAAPAALSFVGYRKIGQLSLDVALFPLLMRALRRADAESSSPLIGASLVQGVRSALHGFGYVALAGATLAVVIEPARLRVRVSRGGTVLAYGLAASFVWLALYLLVLKRPVYPGHAELIALRSLIEPYVAAERLVDPVLSWRGVWGILAAGMIVGAPLLVVGLAPAKAQGRGAAWAFALPSLAFLLLFWPVQGLAREMDLVFAAFPAVYAGAWLCAQSAKRSWLALSILLVGHVVFWWVAGNPGWVNASRNLP